jgi:hypothetical protein
MIVAAGIVASNAILATPASAAVVWQHPFKFRGNLSSPFGWRINPFTGLRAHHNGLDYSGPPGSGAAIYAVAAGIVSRSGYNSEGFGNNITVDHGGGYSSVYGHMLDGTRLPVGATVTPNTIVGKVGSTGASTGAHLHVEIHFNDSPIDPRPLIDNAPPAGTISTPAPLPTEEDENMKWYLRPDGTQTIAGAFSWVDYGIPERAAIVGTRLCDQTAPISISWHEWNILHEEYLVRVGQYKLAFPGSA